MVRVLVVDDSLFMVKMISALLERSGRITVVGHALDGEEALGKARTLRPDVITMDLVMPRMGGLEATRRITQEMGIPIVVLSAHSGEGTEALVDVMAAGAADWVAKPGGELSVDLSSIEADLVNKVLNLGNRMRITVQGGKLPKMDELHEIKPRPSRGSTRQTIPMLQIISDPSGYGATAPVKPCSPRILAIGASAGGIAALHQILPRFPATVPFSIIVIQHLPEGFTHQLAQRLDAICELKVQEARTGDKALAGGVYIAPGGSDLELSPGLTFKIINRPDEPGLHPSVDSAFTSIAAVAGKSVLGVVLTGMGRDGAVGVGEIVRAGGRVLAQDEASSMVYGMPKAAVATGLVDKVLPLDLIPREVLTCCVADQNRAWLDL